MALNNVFKGSEGTLGLAEGGNPTQNADFQAIQTAYGDFTQLGRVHDVELCVRTELEGFYEIGKRDVQSITAGNVHISGTVGRAYLNGAMLLLLLGRGGQPDGLTTIAPRFNMTLSLRNPNVPTNSLQVTVFGVKFETWALRVPQGEFVMENLRFQADRIGAVDTDSGNAINVAFPAQT